MCAAAAAIALDRRLLLEPGQALVGWRAKPSSVVYCDGVLAPKVDVTLEFANPSLTLTITIGELPDGRLFECTY